jgi:hypothetical protein
MAQCSRPSGSRRYFCRRFSISAGLGLRKLARCWRRETAIRLITSPIISRFADRLGKHQQILTGLLALAAVIAFRLFGSGRLRDLPHCQCRTCFCACAHRADCRHNDPCCSARPLPIRMGARRASAAFVVGVVGAGQVVHATSFGGIIWMNGTLLGLAAVAALWLPRNALDQPTGPRRADIRALLAAPGFLPLMALAALVMSNHALHDGFEVLRWADGGIASSRSAFHRRCRPAARRTRWLD